MSTKNHTLRTLGEFILDEQSKIPVASGELSRLLDAIRLAAKIVQREVTKAGLVDIIGAVGETNVQGEEQQKLDIYANDVFIEALRNRREVCGIGSEENDSYIAFDNKHSKNGKYVVLMDPLDGSSNIDVNVSIGTIFSIYERVSPAGTLAVEEDFLQKGTKQVAAGYVIYGSSTMLVFTTGNGVAGFTYDPSIGVFCLSHPNMKIPTDGKIYSINEGNIKSSPLGVQTYVSECQDKSYSARYIGSLVADFHRNLIKGGVYIYPSTSKSPNGKLRLLYECNPLAMLVEQAGGKATNGSQRIMEIEPTELHQRVPYYIGSMDMVNAVEEHLKREVVNS